jgi:1-acyl-sn-glycerol-3-phosphate acyltransferase
MRSYHYIIPIVLQKIGTILSWILFSIFFRLEVRGREYLKDVKGPLILAANHTSELDVAVFALAMPFFSKALPLYYVANTAEKFKTFGWRSYFYGGVFFNMLGAYPIISGRHNYGISLQNHIYLLRKGKTVCIFPEGGRTQDGKLRPARGGIGYMTYITSTPVVPIAIDTFFGLDWKTFLFKRKKILITIGAPMLSADIIPEKNPNVEDFKRGAQRVVDRMGELMRS